MPRPIARPAQVKASNGFTADDFHALEALPSMEKNISKTSYSVATSEKDGRSGSSTSQEYLKHPDTSISEQAQDGLLYRDGLLVKQPAPTKVRIGVIRCDSNEHVFTTWAAALLTAWTGPSRPNQSAIEQEDTGNLLPMLFRRAGFRC